MEVTHCLTMLQPAPKMTHCLLHGVKPTSIRRRQQHHSLGFVARTATSSPFLNCGLRAALDGRRVGLSIRACGSAPPGSDGGNEFEKDVASLLHLLIGLGSGGCSASATPHWDRALQVRDLCPYLAATISLRSLIWSPPMQFEKDVASLLDLFDLLTEARSMMMKGIPIATKFDNEAAKSIELIEQWDKKQGSEDQYLLGLSLIEILINRGEYNMANDVWSKLQNSSPPMDGRLPLRKFIIDLSMQLQSMRDPRWHPWRQIVDTTKQNWEKYKQNYKSSSEPPHVS